MELVFSDVGGRGTEFLRDAFADGLTLGRKISQKVDFSTGRCLALVPAETEPDAIRDFEASGITNTTAASATFATFLGSEMSKSELVLVAENALLKPNDPWRPDEPIERFSFGDEVYEYLCAAKATTARIERLLRLADAGYTLNALLAEATLSKQLPDRRAAIGSGDLERLASGAVLLIVRAYDGESFLIWRPIST